MAERVRRVRPAAAVVAGGSVAALAALIAGPLVERLVGSASLLAYQAVVAVVGAALGLLVLRPAWPRSDPPLPAVATTTGPPRLRELDDLESLVADAARHAAYLHHRLRPRLRALAADALASRQVRLDDPDGPARALLGETAWAWLGPQARPPDGRHGGGPGAGAVADVVAAVARLHDDHRIRPRLPGDQADHRAEERSDGAAR